MNKIYKVVGNAARGCYVVASELVKTHQGKKSARRGGKTSFPAQGRHCSLPSQAGARLAISSMRT